MPAPQWPPAPTEVAYLRDGAGTWFAAEVVRHPGWCEELLHPPPRDTADIRIAWLDCTTVPPSVSVPGWLLLRDALASQHTGENLLEDAARRVTQTDPAAQTAWAASPYYRTAGPSPAEYLLAGFQALCPPHPPCELSPDARDTLAKWLSDRSGTLGLLAHRDREAFNRAVRLYWQSPQDLADAILRERIRDEGGGAVLELTSFLDRAVIDPTAAEFCELEPERQSILTRLAPVRFFTDARDFDGATAAAREWSSRYDRAYRHHYSAVFSLAEEVMHDVAIALSLAGELDVRNREGRAIGQEAVASLVDAVEVLSLLPEAPEPGEPVTAGVVLGCVPTACSQARLAAAAVLAALDVQRRRMDGIHAR